MKFSHLLLAAGLCSFSAASAQTTPPATRSAQTLTPSSAAPALNPNSAANTRSNLPAAGAPDAVDNTPLPPKSERMSGKKHKHSSSSGSSKMKTKM